MEETSHSDSDLLLTQAGAGDGRALQALLTRHRSRLRKMVAIRLDRRLASRVDPSDVVQDTLAEAARRLKDYLDDRPMPFYAWLRRLAWERVLQLHRRHIRASVRSITREEAFVCELPDHSTAQLAERLMAHESSACERLIREEMRRRVQTALAQLAPRDREVLALRFLEQLSTVETAAILGIRVEGVKSRQRRALERFSELMGDESAGGGP